MKGSPLTARSGLWRVPETHHDAVFTIVAVWAANVTKNSAIRHDPSPLVRPRPDRSTRWPLQGGVRECRPGIHRSRPPPVGMGRPRSTSSAPQKRESPPQRIDRAIRENGGRVISRTGAPPSELPVRIEVTPPPKVVPLSTCSLFKVGRRRLWHWISGGAPALRHLLTVRRPL